jgi:hypothetical protein
MGGRHSISVARLIFWTGLLIAGSAVASESPYGVLLDDPFPSASPPLEISPARYRWRGMGGFPAGTKMEWDADSVQWSRIAGRIVLPRARVKIEIPGVEGALVSAWGRTSPLRRSASGSWIGEVVVPLVSGEASKLDVRMRKNGKETEASLTLERADEETADQLGIDSSCSPWRVQLKRRKTGRSALAVLDCQVVRSASAEGLVASLDLSLFLDGAGSELKVNGSTVKAVAPSLFQLRLSSQNQPIILETESGDSFELSDRIPPRLNRGFLGVGIGPYHYQLTAPSTNVDTTAGILTVYGSYQFTDTVRFTAFNATAIHKNYFSDTGLYLKSESFKVFDQRMTIYVMVGANFVGLKYGEETQKKWGAPQGFEASYRDFLVPNYSLVLGAFIYPPIDGKSYYNSWIRYGASSFFAELNYLGIRNTFDGQSVAVRSIGFSLGFPLARFF